MLAPRLLATRPLPEVLAQLVPLNETTTKSSFTELMQPLALIELALARLRLVPNTCLYRALGRYAALRGEGIAVQFVMGVRLEGGEMLGHAWLEHHGRPLGEAIDPRFVITYTYPTML